MGIGMDDVMYMSERGYLPKGRAAVLDIGAQNLYNVTPEKARTFVERHGRIGDEAAFAQTVQAISLNSTPQPDRELPFLSDMFALTPDIFYTSYDICPAPKTEIFDLNAELVPEKYRNHFDIVLNFGTTEHVVNQLNSFRIMHDAVKPGGVVHHCVPSIGWLGHGYFAYHVEFFKDLARANGYALLDHWYTPERAMHFDPSVEDIRDPYRPNVPRSGSLTGLQLTVQSFNLNVVLRKVEDAPFRIGLELATAHSAMSEAMLFRYPGSVVPSLRGFAIKGLRKTRLMPAARWAHGVYRRTMSK